jgi:hypothetical protein
LPPVAFAEVSSTYLSPANADWPLRMNSAGTSSR